MRTLLLLFAVTACFLNGQARTGEAPTAVVTAVVTIVEGKARLLRGTHVFALKEGMLLAPADILETEERSHVQAEFPDGSALGLGPVTSAFLVAKPTGAGRPGEIFLQAGWVKVSGPASAGLIRTIAATLVLHPRSGVFVLRREGPITEFFVESGELVPAGAGRAGARLEPRKAGDFVELKPDRTFTVLSRPNAGFRSAIPRMFLDTLPSRMAKFAGRKVEPEGERAVAFAEADRWIKAYPAERRQLLQRFSPRLKDKDFRAQVDEHASAYPEWSRSLHP